MRAAAAALAGNRAIVRAVAGYALFRINECSAWIAVLVYAYDRGGAAAAGLVAVLQLVPAALLAPVLAVRADRGSPVGLLVQGYAWQVAGLVFAGIAADAGWWPGAFYAGAVVWSAAATAIRPAHAVLLPGLARTPDELTAANVVMSWLEAGGAAVAGLWAAALLVAGVGQVLFAAVVLLAFASLLLARLGAAPPAVREAAAGRARDELREGFRAVATTPGARILVGMLFAGSFAIGALDVLYVVIAIGLLHRQHEWVGYLNSVYGVGGLLSGLLALLLVGRRLPAPIIAAALTVGISLALIAAFPDTTAVIALLALAGAGMAVYNVSCRTLLQRTVPTDVLGRVFGLVEGTAMLALAVGAIAIPAFTAFGGAKAALLGVSAVVVLGVALGARTLLRLDRDSRIPVVEIALLRSVPMLSLLPAPTLEGLARALNPRRLGAGEVLITEGDEGETFYAIADGRFGVTHAGIPLRTVGRGEGVGEIALLRKVRRTASVTAETDALVYALPSEAFLVATTGHLPTSRLANQVVETRLRNDDGA